jgi:hypothetical protein
VFANISALALYFGCAAAAWRLHAGDRSPDSAPSPAIRLAPWLAAAVIAWLLTGVTRGEWLAFGACIAVASAGYVATRRIRRDAWTSSEPPEIRLDTGNPSR